MAEIGEGLKAGNDTVSAEQERSWCRCGKIAWDNITKRRLGCRGWSARAKLAEMVRRPFVALRVLCWSVGLLDCGNANSACLRHSRRSTATTGSKGDHELKRRPRAQKGKLTRRGSSELKFRHQIIETGVIETQEQIGEMVVVRNLSIVGTSGWPWTAEQVRSATKVSRVPGGINGFGQQEDNVSEGI